MIALQDAETLVEQYAKQAGAIRFDGPVLDRDTYARPRPTMPP